MGATAPCPSARAWRMASSNTTSKIQGHSRTRQSRVSSVPAPLTRSRILKRWACKCTTSRWSKTRYFSALTMAPSSGSSICPTQKVKSGAGNHTHLARHTTAKSARITASDPWTLFSKRTFGRFLSRMQRNSQSSGTLPTLRVLPYPKTYARRLSRLAQLRGPRFWSKTSRCSVLALHPTFSGHLRIAPTGSWSLATR